jgi:DNA-binding NarL/FixJ family response regulator
VTTWFDWGGSAAAQPGLDEAHPFVGRGAQTRALLNAAMAAARGEGGLVIIGGEPGIGKTRLVERVAGQAAEAGLDVRWANCWRDDGAPPLWPWIQLLRASPLEDEGPVLALLDRGEAGFALFDAVAGLLLRAAGTRPLLLVLEDIQWADAASLRLLRFLARELRASRLVVIGTYREADPPVHDLLADLGGSRDHLMLRGLAPAEVADLVTRLAHRAPAPDELASLHRRTGGNPLLVRDLVLGSEAPAGGALLRLNVGDGAGRPLSARQWEVARLVADGLGNEEIAERLTISRRTVETHVDHVRRRLALDTRAAIVSWVIRQRTAAP